MQIGLESLIDDELAAYVQESRIFNATLDASAGAQPQCRRHVKTDPRAATEF
jgi:hypothetical protein